MPTPTPPSRTLGICAVLHLKRVIRPIHDSLARACPPLGGTGWGALSATLHCAHDRTQAVGFHRPAAEDPREIQTPNIDGLARTGLELDRHYTYKSVCLDRCRLDDVVWPNRRRFAECVREEEGRAELQRAEHLVHLSSTRQRVVALQNRRPAVCAAHWLAGSAAPRAPPSSRAGCQSTSTFTTMIRAGQAREFRST